MYTPSPKEGATVAPTPSHAVETNDSGTPQRAAWDLTLAEWGVGLTTVGLNVLVNGVLPQRWHVPASLAAAGVVSAFAGAAGARTREQGTSVDRVPAGAGYGVAASLPAAAAVLAAMLSRRTREAFREPRIEDVSAPQAAYEVLARIPFGTALPEELIFRGAVLGLLTQRHSPALAISLSSVLFGLWHIAPTLDRLESNAATNGKPVAHKAARVAMAVAATSAAGVALAWLQRRSGSIVAPWMAHCAVNGTGYLCAWTAARIARRVAASEAPLPEWTRAGASDANA